MLISRESSDPAQNDSGEKRDPTFIDDFNVEINPYYCEDRLLRCCKALFESMYINQIYRACLPLPILKVSALLTTQ